MTPAESKIFWLHVELGKAGLLGEIVSKQIREVSNDNTDKASLEFTAYILLDLSKRYEEAGKKIMEISKLQML